METIIIIISLLTIAALFVGVWINTRPSPQATRPTVRLDERPAPQVRRSSGSRPMATLNRKQRRTIASLQRRGKLKHLRSAF